MSDNEEKIQKAKKLATLLKLPEQYQDAALVALEEITSLNEKLGKTVDLMEEYNPEQLTPLLTELLASISAFRDLVSDKNVDFEPLVSLLEQILTKVSEKNTVTDRTDEILTALKELSKSLKFPEIVVEKTEVDLSGVEEKLDKLVEKEAQEIPLEEGRVPVKLSDEDLDRLGQGIGKETKTYIGNGFTLDVKTSIDDQKQNYKLTDIDDTTSTEYYGYLDKDGSWYIKKVTDTAIRFTSGTSAYATNWTNRTGLSYDYYSIIF